MNEARLIESLRRTLRWFRDSGVMAPVTGEFGVAERVLVVRDPEERRRACETFPPAFEHRDHVILEHKRADCNFQSALLFLEAEKLFPGQGYAFKAERILDFLYFRAGLLKTSQDSAFRAEAPLFPVGGWFWSHSQHQKKAWFDDNAWAISIQYLLAHENPRFDAVYHCSAWADTLVSAMREAFEQAFLKVSDKAHEPGHWMDPTDAFNGYPDLPHWGSLPCLAFAAHDRFHADRPPQFENTVQKYHEYLAAVGSSLNPSEQAYALIGACFAARTYPHEPRYRAVAELLGDALVSRMDPETGVVPSCHYEAPSGGRLADMIYTMNWSLLALQCLAGLTGRSAHVNAFERIASFLLSIQDESPERHLFGCWRGMYDLDASTWGGGECIEGGAGSIYTGWTNAPIAMAFAFALSGRSIADPVC